MSPVPLTRRALLGASLGTAGLLMAGCTEKVEPFSGIDITGADYATGFSLTDHNGQARTLADFKGKVVVIFFGFTQCPDVCPTSL
ncbi:MAG: SCO family protein, partial [Variovorax sp.]|nr:SCO family protein [Variovorax sp.]